MQEKDAKITSLVEALGNTQALLSAKETEIAGVSCLRCFATSPATAMPARTDAACSRPA